MTGASRVTPVYIEDCGLMNIAKRYKKCLLRLISLGADVNARDMAGFTPLHHCGGPNANEINVILAEVLLKAGADVHARNRSGDTPLFHATSYCQYDIIQLLLDHGADPYMGGYGMSATPKDIARSFPRIKSNKKLLKSERDKINCLRLQGAEGWK